MHEKITISLYYISLLDPESLTGMKETQEQSLKEYSAYGNA
jgi:hypothetical protein